MLGFKANNEITYQYYPTRSSSGTRTSRFNAQSLRDEYGEDKFSKVFKTITADNWSEFEDLKSIE